MAASSSVQDQGSVSEQTRLKTASFDANSGWGTLSLFVVEEIMLYLDLTDILESASVCSHWYNVVQGQLLPFLSRYNYCTFYITCKSISQFQIKPFGRKF